MKKLLLASTIMASLGLFSSVSLAATSPVNTEILMPKFNNDLVCTPSGECFKPGDIGSICCPFSPTVPNIKPNDLVEFE
ncbi:hypothetical protein [Yersinia enterocolitica]|uniref:hypothetical protein n=1 Tax=Yersinia enterocolitica TaxID=630 RepID=UPI00111567EB|nr:hypothetical protein [Yersinia enterocolitica]ELI7922504.1 hypothetical protein [Yersinia enterocolitica]EMA9250706.1 hypothetical protein [Yersinia enterocolitica]EMA9425851.1 hypothetical protein [Yersinia enterocolitica]HDL7801928.1 hypothetical protein [Yersinia enterocolitica]HEI6711507.1 hypothetical protein [Yersinia enterocolitica]